MMKIYVLRCTDGHDSNGVVLASLDPEACLQYMRERPMHTVDMGDGRHEVLDYYVLDVWLDGKRVEKYVFNPDDAVELP